MTASRDQTPGRPRRSVDGILLERGWITPDQLERAREEKQKTKLSFGRVLLNLGYVTDQQLTAVMAISKGLEYVNLAEFPLDSAAASLLPESIARRYMAVPIGFEDERLILALTDPTNVIARDDIRAMTGRDIKVVVASREDIEEVLTRLQQLDRTAVELLEPGAGEDEAPDTVGVKEQDAPIVKAVERIITLAVQQRASDIHIEPGERNVRVRYRIDGVLHEKSTLPRNVLNPLVSRVKIMSDMDIAERRVPQDGRITMSVNNKPIDIRVNSMPSIHGEKVVMRILDRSQSALALEQIGFLPEALERYERAYRRPYGMILVTGPTGSGKSTTLYGTLHVISDPTKNIITVEDPVEQRIPGITQVQVNNKAGLTFATALKSILRADPDICMIGEIRDRESAMIAIETALTGHLVLSTLHTNDAPSAVTRLIEMGVEPFLVASAVVCVMGQRLARKLCGRCKAEDEPTAESLIEASFPWHEGEPIPRLHKPVGCQHCARTGYRGRIGIMEVMNFSEEIERMTVERRSSEDIKRVAIQQGMQTLREDAYEKVRRGDTSIQEALRVV